MRFLLLFAALLLSSTSLADTGLLECALDDDGSGAPSGESENQFSTRIGTGPANKRADFDGSAVDDDSVIDEAASLEGDTVLLWGTVEDEDGEVIDGVIWAALQDDTTGAKSAVVIHDQTVTLPTSSSNQPKDFDDNSISSMPEYGGWQTLARAIPNPNETVTSAPGSWVTNPEMVYRWAAFRKFMDSSEWTSNWSTIDLSQHTFDGGTYDIVAHQTSSAASNATPAISVIPAILGLLACGEDDEVGSCPEGLYGDVCDGKAAGRVSCPTYENRCRGMMPYGFTWNGTCDCTECDFSGCNGDALGGISGLLRTVSEL